MRSELWNQAIKHRGAIGNLNRRGAIGILKSSIEVQAIRVRVPLYKECWVIQADLQEREDRVRQEECKEYRYSTRSSILYSTNFVWIKHWAILVRLAFRSITKQIAKQQANSTINRQALTNTAKSTITLCEAASGGRFADWLLHSRRDGTTRDMQSILNKKPFVRRFADWLLQ